MVVALAETVGEADIDAAVVGGRGRAVQLRTGLIAVDSHPGRRRLAVRVADLHPDIVAGAALEGLPDECKAAPGERDWRGVGDLGGIDVVELALSLSTSPSAATNVSPMVC